MDSGAPDPAHLEGGPGGAQGRSLELGGQEQPAPGRLDLGYSANVCMYVLHAARAHAAFFLIIPYPLDSNESDLSIDRGGERDLANLHVIFSACPTAHQYSRRRYYLSDNHRLNIGQRKW